MTEIDPEETSHLEEECDRQLTAALDYNFEQSDRRRGHRPAYLAISVTPMYGPASDIHQVMSVHDTREQAESATAGYNPDYDQAAGCVRCEIDGQYAGRRGEVAYAVEVEVTGDDRELWDSLPSDVQDMITIPREGNAPAIAAALIEAGTLDDAISQTGCEVLWHARTNTYYLVRPDGLT